MRSIKPIQKEATGGLEVDRPRLLPEEQPHLVRRFRGRIVASLQQRGHQTEAVAGSHSGRKELDC